MQNTRSIKPQFIKAVSDVMDRQSAGEFLRCINLIASLRYEESRSKGLMALLPASAMSASAVVMLKTPVRLKDARGVRKMLQVSSPELALLCNGRAVFGFGDSNACRNAPMLEFLWSGRWRLVQRARILVQTHPPNLRVIEKGLSRQRFNAGIRSVFGNLSQSRSDRLWKLILAATRQARGTNVLISGSALAESARLDSQCTQAKPFTLTPALMERVTAIDGTVVMDPTGVCYALGAILDGAVSVRGDRGRGGRYNSALMYVDSSAVPGLMVVVSQDGMVDLVIRKKREVRT